MGIVGNYKSQGLNVDFSVSIREKTAEMNPTQLVQPVVKWRFSSVANRGVATSTCF
jgi:hypothetical protein